MLALNRSSTFKFFFDIGAGLMDVGDACEGHICGLNDSYTCLLGQIVFENQRGAYWLPPV